MNDIRNILVAVDFSPSSACAFIEGARIAARSSAMLHAIYVIIAQDALRWGADAIFLGAKGHSAVERVLLAAYPLRWRRAPIVSSKTSAGSANLAAGEV